MSRAPRTVPRERAALLAYSAGWRLVRLLPEHAAYRLFDVIADGAWRRQGRGVRRLEANLARARPGLDDDGLRELSRAGMRSYLRYWCDSFRLPDWDEQRIVSSVRVAGDEPVREALAAGRGVVMFLGHLGNWDHAGAWSALRLATVTTVAERLRPEELFDRFVGFRERLGMRILPLSGGGTHVFGELMRSLRDGGFVPLLADRDLTDAGVEVDLLGSRARVAGGPAALALQTGAALHPVSIRYEQLSEPGARFGRARGARHGIVITWHDEVRAPGRIQPPESPQPGERAQPPEPAQPAELAERAAGAAARRSQAIAAMTQACADALGRAIREHPQDWHMLQRVFVDDEPEPEPEFDPGTARPLVRERR